MTDDDFFRHLASRIAPLLPPRRPRRAPGVKLLMRVKDLLIYQITPAPSSVSDVAEHELTITVDGGAPVVVTLPLGGTHELALADGVEVTITQVDVDDAANRSQSGPALTFLSADTIPPPAPGAPSAILLREE